MTIEDIARVAHQVNKAYCEAIGDNSQVVWEAAPPWQQSSAINGVYFVLRHPEAPASANHDAWLDQKRREGWKYGEVKDVAKKEHPCFVPYDDLPLSQKAKDHLFKAVVDALEPHLERI